MFSFFKPRPAQPQPPAQDRAEQSARGDAVVDAVLMSGVVLPPYPALLEKLDHLLARDDFELGRLVELVSKDPSLTAAILRVANSPVFGLRQTISNLRQAVTVLGLARTRAVLRSEVLREALHDYGDPALVQTLWQRFGEVGNLAASLASRSSILKSHADLAYSAGIFHGTGCFILAKRFPDKLHRLINAGREFEAWMEKLDLELGSDHAAIGALVARSWRLPGEVVDAIAQQQRLRPGTGALAPAEQLAYLLRLAILLHDTRTLPENWAALQKSVSQQLGLDADALNEALAELGSTGEAGHG